MGIDKIILDIQIITSFARYDGYTAPTYGRYKPFKDLFHYEYWKQDGGLHQDRTNSNLFWTWLYYPRRQQNIPNDENMYDLKYIWYGDSTETLWVLNEIIFDYFKFITNFVRYDNTYYNDHPMYGRYKPFKDLFHYECWRYYGVIDGDRTNSNAYWTWLYYPRHHKNISSDENIYDVYLLFYDDSYRDTLWELIRLHSIYRL